MFETFDIQCIRALIRAQDESRKLHVNWVCSIQMLLGISGMMGTDVAAAIVLSGFQPQEVREILEITLSNKREIVGQDIIPFTTTAKTILESASEKAKRRSVIPHVTLVDLLLAILENPSELLVDTVIESGTHWGTFREQLRKRIQTMAPSTQERQFAGCDFSGQELDENSRQVLTIAKSEIQSYHCEVLGTEHLLLGIFQTDSAIRQILNDAGAQLTNIRKKIQELYLTKQTLPEGVEDTITAEVKEVCNNAALKAKEESTSVMPRHLMLAILSVNCMAQNLLSMNTSQIESITEQLTNKK